VTFENGDAAWYDASEVEPMRGSTKKTHHATKKSPAQLQREIDAALAKPSPSAIMIAEMPGEDPGTYEFYASSADGVHLGWLKVTGDEVSNVEVEPKYRRMGVATALWNAAKAQFPGLRHSPIQSTEGRAWAGKIR
jgi:GNAT superfamily N-acetyltransferase